MNYLKIVFLTLLILAGISTKSQDYGRHLELSLLFYECQRSGPLPKTNRIYWRHDSMVDAGADVGLDLTGGYYDAGDNVKFNFPGAYTITLLAWSGIEFAEGYKKSGQWKYLLEAVKWGTDYFIKCHPEKNVLYAQVGDGVTDHSHWYPPEYIDYGYGSYKVDESSPGSEVAGETAAALAAASILFKGEDSSYSATLLKHAQEIYDFADKFRGAYTASVPAISFYNSFSGYRDELAWGAAWLLFATDDSKYREKYDDIAEAEYAPHDLQKFKGATGPISWDDKRPGCYVLMAAITGDEAHMNLATDYCDQILTQPKTPGGLWYDTGLSQWGSNRYASNAAAMLAIMAKHLPEGNSKRKSYIDFVKSQMDYILGDNPAGVNYVVGAEENSPKAVHHRGSSGVRDNRAEPSYNIYTLYGALAGGPDGSDSYEDDRSNYVTNEVALDYNAGFTICLAALEEFGLGTKDSGAILDFDRAWPQKAPKADIGLEVSGGSVSLSTGSGLLCSGWCISFKSDSDIASSASKVGDKPNYTFCNSVDNNFLDGKGTPVKIDLRSNGAGTVELPKEFEVLCDGFHSSFGGSFYKPEFGHLYKVTVPGGPENTKALFEESKCWPSFIC